MDIRIALAGNPNCGKTTLFNALTGSNQFVGNWPGVTVEKKEGKLKKHEGVIITDLPGIYSLSPYTLEEVVARNYLIGERPDAILNIIDGTNLERNLYLTTQLVELGIPVVIAINMMDIVRKRGDKINIQELSRELGCKIVEISALEGRGHHGGSRRRYRRREEHEDHPAAQLLRTGRARDRAHRGGCPPQSTRRAVSAGTRSRSSSATTRPYSAEARQVGSRPHRERHKGGRGRARRRLPSRIITNERYIYIASIIKACYKKKARREALDLR